MKYILAALLVAGSVGSASAQGRVDPPSALGCACDAPRSAVGRLANIAGAVSVLTRAGLAPAVPGAGVPAGARVIVGPNGSAVLRVLTCSVPLGPNADADLSILSGRLCLRVAQTSPGPVDPTTGLTFDPALAIGGVVVIGGIAGGAIAATSGTRRPPVVPTISP